MSTRAVTPTVVVGIGEAGVRMLSQVAESVEGGNIDDRQFTFLAVDSADDFDDNFPTLSELNRFRLESPRQVRWDDMVENTHTEYLKHGDSPASQGGVTRNRPIARALVDDSENFEALYGFFETRIGNFIDDLGATKVDIWVVNSLGGGTGSGAFLLVSAMLYDLTRRMRQRDPALGFDIAGVGSLPQLTRIDQGRYPDARPRHVINAYIALQELKAMIEHEYESEPLKIEVHAEDVDLFRGDHIPAIEEPIFNKYFLFPVQASEIRDEDTRNRINEIVADLIVYFSDSSGVENYPDTDEDYDDEILFTINEAELGFPKELASEYVQVIKQLDSITDKRNKLNRLFDSYQENTRYLSAVIESGKEEIPSAVESRLVHGCQQKADQTIEENQVQYLTEQKLTQDAESAVEEVREDIRTRVESFDIAVEFTGENGKVRRRIEDDIPLLEKSNGRSFEPITQIIKYFYYTHLEERIEDELSSGRFQRAVDDSWATYRDAVRSTASNPERFEQIDQGGAEEKMEALEKVLTHKINQLSDELEEGGLFSLGIGQSDTEDKLEEIKSTLSSLRDEHERYGQLIELQGIAEERRSAARSDLRTLRDQFEDAAADIERDMKNLERERNKLQNKRNRLTGRERGRISLTEFNPEQFAKMTLEQPQSLTEEDFDQVQENNLAIDDLTASGLTSREQIIEDIEYLLTRQLEERMSDMAKTKPDGLLALLRHEENSWLDSHIRDLVNSRQSRIEHTTQPMQIEDRLTIRLLASYTPINLAETSEFGVLEEVHQESDEQLVKMLISDDETQDIAERYVRYTYPELMDGISTDETVEVATYEED